MYLKFTFTKCDDLDAGPNQPRGNTPVYLHRSPIIIDELLPDVQANTLIHSDTNNEEYFYYLDCETDDKNIVLHAIRIYNDYVFDNRNINLRLLSAPEEHAPMLVREMKRDLMQATLTAERAKIDDRSRMLRNAFYLFGGVAAVTIGAVVVNRIRENYQP